METNSKKSSNIVITLLSFVIIGLVCFIVYDKINESSNNNVVNSNNLETNNLQKNSDLIKEDNEDKEKNDNKITKRTCTGLYSGIAALTQDAQTGQYGKGTLKIELKQDGTYELKKEDWFSGAGEYVIIENALLLKTSPDICGPGFDCSAKYSAYLDISDDCSTISWGYGSYFFDSDFKLTK